MSYQTRISTKKSSFIPTRKFSPPPVLQPKAEKKPDAKLPEWKPGGGGAVSPLQRLIDSPAMQKKQINSPESEAQPEAEIQREKVNEEQKLLSSPMVQRMEAGESTETAPNKTGLPDNLKTGIENLSGYTLDDVRVHYNSPKPSQLQAFAYTQGTEIHVAPGQEQHLPHEAWHVVQQKQGRVKGTKQAKGNELINDDPGLEREADLMGAKALKTKSLGGQTVKSGELTTDIVQLYKGRTGKILSNNVDRRLVLKIVLPGSGDYIWRTGQHEYDTKRKQFKTGLFNLYQDNAEKDWWKEEFRRQKLGTKVNVRGTPVHWVRNTDKKHQLTIVGPGGKGSRGFSSLGGLKDSGSNTIAKNSDFAPYWVFNKIDNFLGHRFEHERSYSDGVRKEVIILIKAHSRNAVAGTLIANRLASTLPTNSPTMRYKIEFVAYDPVPGPGHSGLDQRITLDRRINSTLVYSIASGKNTVKSFRPQEVKGAHRIIITDHDHHAGMVNGFFYHGVKYKGSDLNSLPPGVYFDRSRNDERYGIGPSDMIKIYDKYHGIEMVDRLYREKDQYGDWGRKDRIKNVIKYYFETHSSHFNSSRYSAADDRRSQPEYFDSNEIIPVVNFHDIDYYDLP